VDSGPFADALETAGGNVVGVLFSLTYGEDETSGGPVCTGGEANAPDTITGVATKGEWTLSGADQNPGSHDVNLTWYNASLLSGVIEGLTKSEIEAQLAFGEEALGTYDLAVTVDAEAFNGALCSNNDDGEEVATVVSLLVLDFAILNEDGEEAVALAVGDGSLPVFLFAGWIFPVLFLVGYVSTKQRDRFHLDLDLSEPEEVFEEKASSSDGETLVDSYRARVITLSALYVAQGVPWGFITVTMVTFLAAEGADAGDLAYLLTLGTLPWSFKFLWGPIIDRFQIPELGRRRPWILIAQTGMVALLITMLMVPDLTDNISLLGALFFVYNVFTALQDVSTDALAVDVLQSHEFERVNSYMFTAKSLGGIIGGAGLGTIIGTVGIKGAFLIQIPILVLIMLVPLFMRERPGEKRFPWDDGEVVEKEDKPDEEGQEVRDFAVILSNIRTAFSVRSAQLGIVVSLVISLAFILIPILPLLFLQELGWSQEEFNATKGGIILVVTMLGAMAGGELGRRFGGKSMLMFAALGASLTTLTWGMLDSMWGEGWFMMLVWIIHTFLWAIVSICAYSLMMRVTWAEVGGTQFTGYMAMMNLSAIIGYQLAPIFAERYNYQTLFYIAAVLETFVILAALLIDPEETDRTLNPA
jgi:PAT family beta-lactamase induction signal transducer AmpG